MDTKMDAARLEGEIEGRKCLKSTELEYEDFKAHAQDAILKYLELNGSSSGEDLTDYCKSIFIIPKDDRAFGPVFSSLKRSGKIECVSFQMRRKGHGTSGCRVWGLKKTSEEGT